MINYYELLGMVKEGKAPKKIKAHLTSEPRIYEAEYDCGDFSYYWLAEEKEDIDYHYYLAEDFLESSMFEKNIEILDEKKMPEKLYTYCCYTDFIYNDEKKDDKERFLKDLQNTFVDIEEKINEIRDYLESKEEKK